MADISEDKCNSRASVIALIVITLGCLAPFVNKAFNIDDTLFLWAGKQIAAAPDDFYGFTVNWYGTDMPMAEITKNPPGACYYLALAGSLFGWGEIALHVAFLIPALAAALGTYYLARHFCSQPLLAALAAVLTPVFLVCSTSVMCDTTMLALWVWSAVLWVGGTKANDWRRLFLGAVLIALCALTKYYGMALLPLFFAYSLMQRRKLGTWILFLLVPVAVLAGYQWVTHVLYGKGLLLDAASYATETKVQLGAELLSSGLTGLAFWGGCVITGLFYLPLLWSRGVLIRSVFLTCLFILALTYMGRIGSFPTRDADGEVMWNFLMHMGLMAAVGLSLLALAGVDFWKSRNAESLLLLLWVVGTFIFAGFINWTVNARSVLPLVPAIGILLARRLDQRGLTKVPGKNKRIFMPLVPAVAVALLVSWADYAWAGTARTAAARMHERFADHKQAVWFQGHWGFQYYMEANGYKALDLKNINLTPGDALIVPSNNCNLALPSLVTQANEVFWFVPCRWLATMEPPLGAGFYADVWGPLPYAFGKVRREDYYVFVIRQQEGGSK